MCQLYGMLAKRQHMCVDSGMEIYSSASQSGVGVSDRWMQEEDPETTHKHNNMERSETWQRRRHNLVFRFTEHSGCTRQSASGIKIAETLTFSFPTTAKEASLLISRPKQVHQRLHLHWGTRGRLMKWSDETYVFTRPDKHQPEQHFLTRGTSKVGLFNTEPRSQSCRTHGFQFCSSSQTTQVFPSVYPQRAQKQWIYFQPERCDQIRSAYMVIRKMDYQRFTPPLSIEI